MPYYKMDQPDEIVREMTYYYCDDIPNLLIAPMQLIDDCSYGSSLIYFSSAIMSDRYGGRPNERPPSYVRAEEATRSRAS